MEKMKRDVFGLIGRLWQERRPLAVSIIVLLAGLPIVFFLALQQRGVDESPTADKALKDAQVATEDGDYAEAYDKLKAVQSQAGTKAQQLEFLGQLAAAAANDGKPSEAIGYLQQKHQLDPSTAPGDAYMLASLHMNLDKQAEALTYYNAAVEYYRSLPSDDFTDSRIKSVETIIAELEAGNE